MTDREQYHEIGCGDGGCVFRRPTGMHTNGGCRCLPRTRDYGPTERSRLRRWIGIMRDRIADQERELAEARRRVEELEERIDLGVDEFARIKAELYDALVGDFGPKAQAVARSVYGICDRAINAGRQRVPLIEQRDAAERRALEATGNRAVAQAALEETRRLRRFEEWHDDDRSVLWWHAPVGEPPYVGSPGDSDWPWEDEDEPWLVWLPCPNPSSDGRELIPKDQPDA